MCAVSMVLDYGQTYIPIHNWTIPVYNDYLDIVRRLDELDKKLDQKECHDPDKAKWTEEVEARLSKLEGAEKLHRLRDVFPA